MVSDLLKVLTEAHVDSLSSEGFLWKDGISGVSRMDLSHQDQRRTGLILPFLTGHSATGKFSKWLL